MVVVINTDFNKLLLFIIIIIIIIIIKGDTKDNTEGNDVCYKNTNKKRITNYYKVQHFE